MIATVFAWIAAHEALLTWVFAVLSGVLTVLQQTGSLQKAAVELFLQAEKDHPGKPGPELMDKAVDYALKETVPHLPAFLRPFATRQNVEAFLAWTYRKFRSRLETGAMQNTPAPAAETFTLPAGNSSASTGGETETAPPGNQ